MKTFRHLALAALAAAAIVSPAAAKSGAPFGSWLELAGNDNGNPADPGHGYVEIPHHASFNINNKFTFEAWVKLETPVSCRSIAGKSYPHAWWIGVCGSTLRTYLSGSGSARDGGIIPNGKWTHIAVVFDGGGQYHYVNGVIAAEFEIAGPLDHSAAPIRIGSDVSYEYSPAGAIDEVRLWNVARSGEQLKEGSLEPITSPQTGLVAVWSLDGNGEDELGHHDGQPHGNAPFVTTPNPPPGEWLTTSALPGFRFKVRINEGTTGTKVNDCVPETLCVAGAIPSRAEVFVRIVGPKPNGYLWPNVIKFTTSRVEVWMEQLDSGDVVYYELNGASPDVDELPGLFDRSGFLP
jgi:hypothetical protein